MAAWAALLTPRPPRSQPFPCLSSSFTSSPHPSRPGSQDPGSRPTPAHSGIFGGWPEAGLLHQPRWLDDSLRDVVDVIDLICEVAVYHVETQHARHVLHGVGALPFGGHACMRASSP
eukprot:8837893-Pyramimonas_sp.AAC.1